MSSHITLVTNMEEEEAGLERRSQQSEMRLGASLPDSPRFPPGVTLNRKYACSVILIIEMVEIIGLIQKLYLVHRSVDKY